MTKLALPRSTKWFSLFAASLLGAQQPAQPVPSSPARAILLVPQPPSAARATSVTGQPAGTQNSGGQNPSSQSPAVPVAGTPLPNGTPQDPVPAQQNPQAPATQPGAEAPQDPAAAAAAAEAQKKAEQEQKKQERLQKIAQVVFDRRATTIFRTWSAPADAGVVTGDLPPAAAAAAPPAQSGEVVLVDSTARSPIPGGVVIVSGSPIAATPTTPAPNATDAPPADSAQPTAPGATPAPGAAPGQPTTPPVDPFDLALKQWARAVTLGDWGKVKEFLASLQTDDEKKAAWNHLLMQLGQPPQDPNQKPFFAFGDVLGLCAAAPLPKEDANWAQLGVVLTQVVQRGLLLEPMLAQLRAITNAPAGGAPLTRREVVKLLFGAGQQAAAGEFLGSVDELTKAADFEGLVLVAQHLIAKHDRDGKQALLEQAWGALQNVFAGDKVDRKQKDAALKTAVGLAPRLRKELGQDWLGASFTKDVERGMEIIASIGVAAADAAVAQAANPAFRQMTLQLQQTAILALLHAAPERAKEWSTQLSLLADNWLREANATYTFDQSTGYYPSMRRDRYGNFFYYDEQMANNGQTIKASDVLDLVPSAAWIAQLEAGMQPKFAMMTAQLWLKVQEEAKAFPHIAELAKTHPKQAKELCDEFLRVWTKNHDPNAGRNNYYFYGYETRADGIPLTRSKQQRNLEDLAKWVGELKKLPIEGPDEALLAQAFTTCHSSAEVYRQDAIEKVFGSLGGLKPSTLAALAQQMRGNLATMWRAPSVQEKAKTKRKQKDIEAEVQRGYEVARSVIDGGLAQHPDEWSLLLVRAMLKHDAVDYARQLGNEVKFAELRLAAFEDFAAAAAAYAAKVADLPREEETVQPYEHWFYAALGASDVEAISHQHVQVQSQVEAVRTALAALPGDAAERHLARFAGMLFTRMGNLNPATKLRFVKAGLDVVGEHKQAFEAQKLYDYYKDIASEIRLEARIDGPTTVGHGEPFGMFVEIRHTRDIERESGGFGRYLRNQNDVSYSYNYGRPTENYREKFAEAARASLQEHFEVMSITFQNESVHSRTTEQDGWRVTPYAYVLLKPRGPQVDRVPPVRLDLDFLDTSGYVVLPVETSVVAIDAKAEKGPTRPCDKVEVTQILDERQAAQGKLVLEVKATCYGLPPKLDDVVTMPTGDFEVANVDDTGPQISRFDPEGATDAVQAERTWTITFAAKKDLAEHPKQFAYPTAKLESAKVLRQRYADADLVAAEPVVDLLAQYGTPRSNWPYVAGGCAVLLALVVGFLSIRRRPTAVVHTGLQLPSQLTPFTVLGLLQQIRQTGGLDANAVTELDAAMRRIEAGFFATASQDAVDLQAVATTWVSRAQNRSAG